MQQRDWDAHGHGDDPRYNGVVLHVVGKMDDPYSTLHSGCRVPVLSLEPLLHGGPSTGRGRDLWLLLQAQGYFAPSNVVEMSILLDRAGDSRFLGKSDAHVALLNEEEPEQVLYSGLMEALGYSQNREPFLELACRVPYRLLEKVARESPPSERRATIQDLLLTAAGFLAAPPNANTMSRARWHLFRIRPQNYPSRRIVGFAYLLDLFLPSSEAPAHVWDGSVRQHVRPPGSKIPSTTGGRGQRSLDLPPRSIVPDKQRALPTWAGRGLVEGMTRLVRSSPGQIGGSGCWRALETALTGMWGTAQGVRTADYRERNEVPIGKDRARDMAVNSVLPFLHALAQLRRGCRACGSLFQSIPDIPQPSGK